MNIILGIVSGVITSFVLWLLYQFFSKVIIPWFETLVYKGIIISGNWKTTVKLSPDNFVGELTIVMDQKGHKLSGSIIARYVNNEQLDTELTTRRLNFTGSIIDNNITLTYRSASRNITSLGTFLLKLVRGGEELKGCMLGVDGITGEILAYKDVIWKRE